MKVYGQAGIEGIFLTQDSFRGDWPGSVLDQIEGILKRRLEGFQTHTKR